MAQGYHAYNMTIFAQGRQASLQEEFLTIGSLDDAALCINGGNDTSVV